MSVVICRGCNKAKLHKARGMCSSCQTRARRHPEFATLQLPPRKIVQRLVCTAARCCEKHHGKGFCKMHFRKFCEQKKIVKCRCCFKFGIHQGRGLCTKCWQRHKYHGTLEQYSIYMFKIVSLLSDGEYAALEKWIDDGPQNVAELAENYKHSERFFERLKTKLHELKVEFVHGANYRICPVLTRDEAYRLSKYRRSIFTKLPTEKLRARKAANRRRA